MRTKPSPVNSSKPQLPQQAAKEFTKIKIHAQDTSEGQKMSAPKQFPTFQTLPCCFPLIFQHHFQVTFTLPALLSAQLEEAGKLQLCPTGTLPAALSLPGNSLNTHRASLHLQPFLSAPSGVFPPQFGFFLHNSGFSLHYLGFSSTIRVCPSTIRVCPSTIWVFPPLFGFLSLPLCT